MEMAPPQLSLAGPAACKHVVLNMQSMAMDSKTVILLFGSSRLSIKIDYDLWIKKSDEIEVFWGADLTRVKDSA